MLITVQKFSASIVALRKESVDRNNSTKGSTTLDSQSLSARRAWIEICKPPLSIDKPLVALRKESVDRNARSHR